MDNIEQMYRLFFQEYPDVLDTKQLSQILDVCEKTVLQLLNKQEIRSIKVGRLYRIPKLYLLQYLGLVPTENVSTQEK